MNIQRQHTFRSFLLLVLYVLCGLYLGGCTTEPKVPYENTYPQYIYPPQIEYQPINPTIEPPSSINIKILVQDYVVVNHKILDSDPTWGKFRFSGKFSHFDELVFKFKSDKFPKYYWMARLPTLPNGELEISALIFEEPSRDLHNPPSPPIQISISALVREGKIANHSIQNPHPGWGIFSVARYHTPILVVKNPYYPGCEWQGQLPIQDGGGEFYLVLQTNSCKELQNSDNRSVN